MSLIVLSEKNTALLTERPGPPSRSARASTHTNFQRFTHLLEELSAVGSGLSEVEADHLTLRRDIEALLHMCSETEEGERGGLQLSEACSDFAEVEAGVRTLQEDLRAVDQCLDRIRENYRQRQRRLEALRMDSELLLSSLLTGGETGES